MRYFLLSIVIAIIGLLLSGCLFLSSTHKSDEIDIGGNYYSYWITDHALGFGAMSSRYLEYRMNEKDKKILTSTLSSHADKTFAYRLLRESILYAERVPEWYDRASDERLVLFSPKTGFHILTENYRLYDKVDASDEGIKLSEPNEEGIEPVLEFKADYLKGL